MAEVAEKPAVKAPQPLEPARFKSAEFERNIWIANADEGTNPADLLNPDYWAHNAQQMRSWDRVEVRANDGTWFAELLVVDATRLQATVKMLAIHDLSGAAPASLTMSDSPYKVEWKGPQLKWVVVRKSDGEKVSDGHQNKGAAETWAAERQKAG